MFTGYKTLIIDGSEMITDTTTWEQFFNMVKELFETTLGYTATAGECYNKERGRYFTLPTLEGADNVESIPCIIIQKYSNKNQWDTIINNNDNSCGIFYDIKDRNSSKIITDWTSSSNKITDYYVTGNQAKSGTSIIYNNEITSSRYRFSFYAMSSKSFLINALYARNNSITLTQLENFTPIYSNAFTTMEKDGIVKNVGECRINTGSYGYSLPINFISGSESIYFPMYPYSLSKDDTDSVCLNEFITPNWSVPDIKIVVGNNPVIREYFRGDKNYQITEGVKDGIIINGVHYLGAIWYSSEYFTIFEKPLTPNL